MESLKFWNEEKIQKNIFSDSQGNTNVIKLSVWNGGKNTGEIRACVIKRSHYKVLTIRDKEITDHTNNQFRLPDGEENILVHKSPTPTVDWNPEHIEQIAVGLANSYVLHWNIETAKCIRLHKAVYENKSSGSSFTRSRTLTCIQWSLKDPNLLIYGTKDPYINVWDVRAPEPAQTFVNDGVLDIKFDPFDENQFAVASENHDVTIYDLRNLSSDKIRSEKGCVTKRLKFSAHENRTLQCEWNPKVRNRLATSGQANIKIWHLDYSKEYDQLKEKTLITTRNCAYSIKWSPQCDHLLASHSHSSKYIEIWDTNRKFRPYLHFKEEPVNKDSWNSSAKMGKLLIHWHEWPHALLTLNTNNADLSMHARRDAINMENFAPSCAVSCSPYGEMGIVTAAKPSKRQVTSLPESSVPDRSYIFTKRLGGEGGGDDPYYSTKFIDLANRYKTRGDSLEELCTFNAQVAKEQGLLHVASNWRLLSVLYATEEITLPFYEEIIHLESQGLPKRSNTLYSDRGAGLSLTTFDTPESAEHESDSDNIEPYRYVTEQECSEDENYPLDASNTTTNYQWDMLDEPFTQQAVIQTDSIEAEDLSDRSSLPDTDQGLYSYDNFHQDTMTSVRHKTESMKINLQSLTRAMLDDLVSEGDVQTACTMLLVLDKKFDIAACAGHDQMVLDDMIATWFHAYLDLLSRFKLWTVQCQVVARAPDRIKLLNSKSIMTAMCARCTQDKLADKYGARVHSGACARCGPVAVCALCRLAVRGLYVWCQGCCHGGHPDHMEQWFRSQRLCPAACGHECEFS